MPILSSSILTIAVAAAVATTAAASLPASDVTAQAARSSAPGAAAPARALSPLQQAVARVRAEGYTPRSTRQYKPWAKLRVLVGTATGSATGHNLRAFFFVGRRYIGTDKSSPSGTLGYVGQTSTRVRLRYGVYGPGSADCCPTSHRTVRFQYDGKRLVALDRIP